jgi:cell division FtsZ-interacting protein ZapD
MLRRTGKLPPVPEELQGRNLRVEFTSTLAQAQKLVGIGSTERWLGNIGQMAEVFPQARHKVRVFKTVDKMADILGVDPEMVASDDEAMESLAQEMQQHQAAQMAETASTAAKGAKDLSEAEVGGSNALEQLVGAGG